jgi:hypothetical protein
MIGHFPASRNEFRFLAAAVAAPKPPRHNSKIRPMQLVGDDDTQRSAVLLITKAAFWT